VRLGPFVITRRQPKAIQKAGGTDLVTQWPISVGGASWWPWIRESFAGAWQRGITTPVQDAVTNPTFWACVTLIAGDIAKMRLKLITEDPATGICTEAESPSYSPVIRKPNHYQNRIQFYTYWILSKLMRGNAYALKERDGRGVVTALYLLDPMRTRVMVTPSGDVYYAVGQDWLSGVTSESVVVPAKEIIHDLMFPLYHPLVGLSPIYACGHAAMQGLQISHNTTRLFKNGTQIGGVLTAPGIINNETAKRLEKYWEQNYAGPDNVGKIVALGDGLKFDQPKMMSAVDSQLIDQLKWSDEKICSTFHVPAYMVGVGPPPNYNNIEALNQQYYTQCLQVLIESLELVLSEGLELSGTYDVEFDLEGLLRMDSAQKMEVATKGVVGGVLSPNEARATFNRAPVEGGETPYLQQQNFSLAALARRDAQTPVPPTPVPTPPPAARAAEFDEDAALALYRVKAVALALPVAA
jgi:HK97 family phage portal protein